MYPGHGRNDVLDECEPLVRIVGAGQGERDSHGATAHSLPRTGIVDANARESAARGHVE